MRVENLPELEIYIDGSIGTTTTRHASEERFECPSVPEAVNAERIMRSTLHTMYDSHVSLEPAENHVAVNDLDGIKEAYWHSARHTDAAHGARPGFELDDYFHVSQDRSYETIRASVLAENEPDSITVKLFSALDTYQQILGVDSTTSSRLLTTLLNASLPTVKRNTLALREAGLGAVESSRQAIANFTEYTVGEHVTFLQERTLAGQPIKALVNKASSYPQSPDQEHTDDVLDDILRVSRADAQGIAKMYRVQERPYTDIELALGDNLMRTPSLQRAILLFHQEMVRHSAAYLAAHPERAKYSLEPFSEIFLAEHQEGEQDGIYLIPNPKLIKVIGNNTVPAIARILLEEDTPVQGLTGDHIQRGIELAKKLRVFQTQIGQFNGYDPITDTVSLRSLFNRTCPAMQMFSEALTRRLPDLYDESRTHQA